MKLSKNFTLEEMTFSDTAVRHGYDNQPNPLQLSALQTLCEKCLQPIRNHFGPVRITSGFRNLFVNNIIGGAQNSQHTKGEAADFFIPGKDLRECFDYISENFEFDQLIYEFGRWIHISFREGSNRNQRLIAIKKNGKTHYEAVE